MYNTNKKLIGAVCLKGDKSISHRLLMIASLIDGVSEIKNLSYCNDVKTTISCLKKCGISVSNKDFTIYISGGKFYNPKSILDCKNSGSTARMLLGLLSSQKINATFNGDSSLRSRPMNRIINPLQNMGVSVKSKHGRLPITIKSVGIKKIKYIEKTKSAQVKTALIFAASGCDEYSTIAFDKSTRDHTEVIMNDAGFDISINDNIIVKKTFVNNGIIANVPGDISNAAFIIAGAILIPDSSITIKKVLYNKTRLGFINVLLKMGAKINIYNISTIKNGMQVCDIDARYSHKLNPVQINGSNIVELIDEIPIYCIVAVLISGRSSIVDAKELKYKESNRLKAIYDNLHSMGADISLTENGLIINGGKKLYNTTINHYNDHRIAMSFEVLQLALGLDMTYEYQEIIDISFPDFYKTLNIMLK